MAEEKEAAVTVSHYRANKLTASASRYVICPLPDCDRSTKKFSLIWFGSTSVDVGAEHK